MPLITPESTPISPDRKSFKNGQIIYSEIIKTQPHPLILLLVKVGGSASVYVFQIPESGLNHLPVSSLENQPPYLHITLAQLHILYFISFPHLNLSREQIAEALGIKHQTLKNQLHQLVLDHSRDDTQPLATLHQILIKLIKANLLSAKRVGQMTDIYLDALDTSDPQGRTQNITDLFTTIGRLLKASPQHPNFIRRQTFKPPNKKQSSNP